MKLAKAVPTLCYLQFMFIFSPYLANPEVHEIPVHRPYTYLQYKDQYFGLQKSGKL
jgi:hypothetical protein